MTYSFDNMINKPLQKVELINDKDKITFTFQDGSTRSFGVEGDCCSTSWIEHLTVPTDITGAVITSVEDGEGIAWDNHECTGYRSDGGCGHDCLAVYNTHFVTNKGDIILEYRNDSNGYYGGYLIDVD